MKHGTKTILRKTEPQGASRGCRAKEDNIGKGLGLTNQRLAPCRSGREAEVAKVIATRLSPKRLGVFQLLGQCLLLLMFSLANVSDCSADNWPQWRGKDLASKSSETSVPSECSKDKNMLWRTPMPGPAGASPVVWGDNAFVTSIDGEKLVLICVDVKDGKVKWNETIDGVNSPSRDNANSASPSPSTDGQHVWAMMGNGVLVCHTVQGEKVWQKDLQDTYGKFIINFGMSTTPILDKGKLYIALMHGDRKKKSATSVGQVIALDAKTGDEIWMQLRKTDGTAETMHSYASPTIYRDSEREFLITQGADYVIGHSLQDGAELWRCGGFNPHGDSYNPTLRLVSSPVCRDGIVVVPTAKRGPVLGLKVDLEGNVTDDPEAMHWRLDQGTPDVASPVIFDGHVYLAGEKGDLTCVEVATGEIKYRKRLFSDKHRSTPVAADGKIFIADSKGTVFVVKAGPELEVLSKNKLGEETTASPAISNGRILIRTHQALYAFGVK
jgi:outer membrane protein assembly factor BamB